jgi:hypothetical protein
VGAVAAETLLSLARLEVGSVMPVQQSISGKCTHRQSMVHEHMSKSLQAPPALHVRRCAAVRCARTVLTKHEAGARQAGGWPEARGWAGSYTATWLSPSGGQAGKSRQWRCWPPDGY